LWLFIGFHPIKNADFCPFQSWKEKKTKEKLVELKKML